jgi:integrase
VAVGNKAMLAVDGYLRTLAREWPERIGAERPLWYGRAGRMSTSGVTDVLHRMCDDAGVERLHWHQLRHTWAHVQMAAGAPEGDIMVQAGWSSRAMLDVYARALKVKRAHDTARRLNLGDRV